jgi:hypothetical protein
VSSYVLKVITRESRAIDKTRILFKENWKSKIRKFMSLKFGGQQTGFQYYSRERGLTPLN